MPYVGKCSKYCHSKAYIFFQFKRYAKRTSFVYCFYITQALALSPVSYIAHSPFTDRMEEFTRKENHSTQRLQRSPMVELSTSSIFRRCAGKWHEPLECGFLTWSRMWNTGSVSTSDMFWRMAVCSLGFSSTNKIIRRNKNWILQASVRFRWNQAPSCLWAAVSTTAHFANSHALSYLPSSVKCIWICTSEQEPGASLWLRLTATGWRLVLGYHLACFTRIVGDNEMKTVKKV